MSTSFDNIQKRQPGNELLSGESFNVMDNSAPEHDPSNLSSDSPGAKLDAGKPRVSLMMKGFPRALLAVSEVTAHGAVKYSELGFLKVVNGESRYADAGMRHFLKRFIEGDLDSELPVYHLAQVAWNALAELEFMCKRLSYPEKPMDRKEGVGG